MAGPREPRERLYGSDPVALQNLRDYTLLYNRLTSRCFGSCVRDLGCVTGYQIIRVIQIFAITYPFE
ncbi:hypothetical protein EMCRGX_G033364 [Ephydatia muelleri]